MDLEAQKKNFEKHITKFTDYGNIKILDFEEPGTSHYRIRFLFEEDYCRLHISGDLGELSATNYNNMRFDHFGDFVNNTGYFEEKIDCHSRDIYMYDENEARKDFLELIERFDLREELGCVYDWESDEESINDVMDEIFSDYDDRIGLSQAGYAVAEKYIDDFWEYASDLGKRETGILDLYMLAFKLAKAQLN